MPRLQTGQGPVDTAGLGRVLMHEHVVVLTADVQRNHPEERGSEVLRIAGGVEKLQAPAATGVRRVRWFESTGTC